MTSRGPTQYAIRITVYNGEHILLSIIITKRCAYFFKKQVVFERSFIETLFGVALWKHVDKDKYLLKEAVSWKKYTGFCEGFLWEYLYVPNFKVQGQITDLSRKRVK